MILILKRIPETTRVPDIEEFIQPALQGGFLKKSGRIESLKIQMMRLPGSSHAEYHAIVKIQPAVVGMRVIKLLNRKPCNGKPINVCEFHFRHRDNEKRQSRYQRAPDRRKSDRRRKELETVDITAERKGPKLDYILLEMKY